MSHFPHDILNVSPTAAIFNQSSTVTQTFTGDYITQNITVEISGLVVNSVTYIDSHTVSINFTTLAVDADYDITFTNEFGSVTLVNGISVVLSAWKDLRLGGDPFTHGNGAGNDIRYKAGANLVRDAAGMYFTGFNVWQSWVKFESLGWVRGTNQTCQWVFNRPTGAMMVGIGSDGTNEGSGTQYQEMEVEAFFQNSNGFWGLYGNNGTTGSAGNQNVPSGIVGGSGFFKVKFESDGDAGDTFTLYRINTGNPVDWDDETQVVSTFAIGGSLNPNEANLMPSFLPVNAGTQRAIAVKVGA